MDNFKYVAVILVYRNSADLEECIISMQARIKSLKIVVVNAFYDEYTMQEIESIAKKYECDYLNIENKGYSYGNNYGINHAKRNYKYKYIIISNPDIIIRHFDDVSEKYDIIAPTIRARNDKMQNPMLVKRNHVSEKLIYAGFNNNNRLQLYAGITLTKIQRFFFLKRVRNKTEFFPIYQPHGSFVIINKRVIDVLHPLFDENMFLFAEENVLAWKAQKFHFQPFYYPGIQIEHKEDGSMKLAGTLVNEELKKSNLYFFEHYLASAQQTRKR